ncbi:MAG: CinA family nicotinamide mononucleotide deamidase-related protein, partial [Gloeobacteraceae cyanobacterium ES-bin-316]|nr:CinA family nicotinamide mononucleotide deamidase-related protein [Ferruginibacter sp.]
MTNVSIITIGDELLIGQVIDTNSAWMAQELNKAGIRVKRRVAVADVWDEIWQALDQEAAGADVILITGGLGPTADDITKPLLCKYFGGKLVQNEAALQNVTYLFEKIFKRELTPRNVKQANVPDVCTVLQNKRGTAPGMLFNKAGKIFVSMPGVPNEMQGMMTDNVIPLLKEKFPLAHVTHRTLLTFGIGESMLADMIQNFEEALPAYIKLAYLPNYGMVRLRLTASGTGEGEINTMINQQFEKLQHLVKEYLVTNEDIPMQKVLGNLLMHKNKTLSTAESCTGGYIAHLITSLTGSSAFYDGTVVSYSNEVKSKLLGVQETTLSDKGAVSEAVVREMLIGVLKHIHTDYAIAVSGIMGPDGGSQEKPVGTVWIAAGNTEKQIVQKFHFRFNRQKNIEL